MIVLIGTIYFISDVNVVIISFRLGKTLAPLAKQKKDKVMKLQREEGRGGDETLDLEESTLNSKFSCQHYHLCIDLSGNRCP